jgi:hypothetical protein
VKGSRKQKDYYQTWQYYWPHRYQHPGTLGLTKDCDGKRISMEKHCKQATYL